MSTTKEGGALPLTEMCDDIANSSQDSRRGNLGEGHQATRLHNEIGVRELGATTTRAKKGVKKRRYDREGFCA